MRIGRTLPPAAAPLLLSNLVSGLAGWHRGTLESKRFAEEIKAVHGTGHVFLVSSGKAALYLILRALKSLQPSRDEVLVPAFTCYSVPSAILKAGLRVRLCDIDPDTLDFDYACLDAILTSTSAKRLLAVVPTHLFGIPSDVTRVKRMVSGTGVKVVEDAAQSMGAKVKGQRTGTLGDVGFFSLGRGKALSTVEGGAVLTGDTCIAMAMKEDLRYFGHYSAMDVIRLVLQAVVLTFFTDPRFFWLPKALPFLRLGETHLDADFPLKKMSGFQAGVARGWQNRLTTLCCVRKCNADKWAEALKHWKGFRVPKVCGDFSFLRYPLLVMNPERRSGILEESEAKGLGVMQAYPDSLDRLDVFAQSLNLVCCAKAQAVAKQMITLPVHGYVNHGDYQRMNDLLAPYD